MRDPIYILTVQIQKGTLEKVPSLDQSSCTALLFFRNRYSWMSALILLVNKENARPHQRRGLPASAYSLFLNY